jgi:hypothetical protein
VRTNLGATPAIFLAVEELQSEHLTGHSFFFFLNREARALHRALLSETWCLASSSGEFTADGILRPHRANAGVRALDWLRADVSPSPARPLEEGGTATLPDGFYAGRVFIFPNVSPSRRFICKLPKGLGAALGKIFTAGAAPLFEVDRAWLRISMPQDATDLHTGLTAVGLHTVTASNVECFNQTVDYAKHGRSIPVSHEAGAPRHLVAPLSVMGSQGSAYLPEFEPSIDPDAGRYGIRNGRIELRPARRSDGAEDTSANLRLWLTAGTAGNHVGLGQVKTLLKPGNFNGLTVSNPMASTGGTDGETFQESQVRFAEALLARDRIVTRADLMTAVRAFDRRILRAETSPALSRDPSGLRRVERVNIWLNRSDFVDPMEEGRVLQEELAERLQRRVAFGTEVRVDVVWE